SSSFSLSSLCLFLSFSPRPSPRPPLFPYTTLFRSKPPRSRFGSRDRHGQCGTAVLGCAGLPHLPIPLCSPCSLWLKVLPAASTRDRKSTRLNSSHRTISYAVFCLKKKKS